MRVQFLLRIKWFARLQRRLHYILRVPLKRLLHPNSAKYSCMFGCQGKVFHHFLFFFSFTYARVYRSRGNTVEGKMYNMTSGKNSMMTSCCKKKYYFISQVPSSVAFSGRLSLKCIARAVEHL